MYGVYQTNPLSIPNTTIKLDTSVDIDDESQYFVAPIKHNHSATEPIYINNVSDHIPLVSDTMGFHKITQLLWNIWNSLHS